MFLGLFLAWKYLNWSHKWKKKRMRIWKTQNPFSTIVKRSKNTNSIWHKQKRFQSTELIFVKILCGQVKNFEKGTFSFEIATVVENYILIYGIFSSFERLHPIQFQCSMNVTYENANPRLYFCFIWRRRLGLSLAFLFHLLLFRHRFCLFPSLFLRNFLLLCHIFHN